MTYYNLNSNQFYPYPTEYQYQVYRNAPNIPNMPKYYNHPAYLPQQQQPTLTPRSNIDHFELMAQVKTQIDVCNTVKLAVEQSQKSVALASELLYNVKAHMHSIAENACAKLKQEMTASTSKYFKDHEERLRKLEYMLHNMNQNALNKAIINHDISIMGISDQSVRATNPTNPTTSHVQGSVKAAEHTFGHI